MTQVKTFGVNRMVNLPPGGFNPYTEPPTASNGQQFYIAKLLTQGGMAPPSEYKDGFQKSGVIGAQKRGAWADKILKWAGVIFAGALGIVGLRYAFARQGAAKVASTVASKT